MKKILEGIRVLDITQAYSGPFCSMHLADHGAEVIKVEPISGEQTRYWEPIKNGYSGYFAYLNRNKKGIAIDLKSEAGKEALRRLIRMSDVVVENFRVGTFARLGFSYEKIREINPKIIYASVSGFGINGPMAKHATYDIVAQAESGLMSLGGYPGKDPLKIGPAIGDSFSGTYLALGIMMALFARERTGEGARVDVAMIDTMFSVLEENVMIYTLLNKVSTNRKYEEDGAGPWDSYKAKDGMFVVACGTEDHWSRFCQAMQHIELIDDPKYKSLADRKAHYIGDLKSIIEEWSMTKTLDELEKIFVEVGIPFGRVRSVKECAESEQTKARNMIWSVYDPGFDEVIKMPGSPIKIHGENDDIRRAAPTIGQDNINVLKKLAGFTDEEITAMMTNGVIS